MKNVLPFVANEIEQNVPHKTECFIRFKLID